MNCWITMRCPNGELEDIGPVFTDKNQGEEWCKNKNNEDGYENWISHEWYLEETTLEKERQPK